MDLGQKWTKQRGWLAGPLYFQFLNKVTKFSLIAPQARIRNQSTENNKKNPWFLFVFLFLKSRINQRIAILQGKELIIILFFFQDQNSNANHVKDEFYKGPKGMKFKNLFWKLCR